MGVDRQMGVSSQCSGVSLGPERKGMIPWEARGDGDGGGD